MQILFKAPDTTNETELQSAFLLMQDLRPGLEFAHFKRLVCDQAPRQGDYRILGAVEVPTGKWIAIAGIRTLLDFVHGEHWYIDDLVTHADHRNQGVGARLLKCVEAEAARAGIRCLRLSTGVTHEPGKRFYEREGWGLRAVTYKKYWNPTTSGWET